MIAFSNRGDSISETPYSYLLQGQNEPTRVIVIGGDLRIIDVVRAFWQMALDTLEDEPTAIWLNLTNVSSADTKLAACLVAILRRAQEHETQVYIVGSNAVHDILKLCMFPELKQFTKVA